MDATFRGAESAMNVFNQGQFSRQKRLGVDLEHGVPRGTARRPFRPGLQPTTRFCPRLLHRCECNGVVNPVTEPSLANLPDWDFAHFPGSRAVRQLPRRSRTVVPVHQCGPSQDRRFRAIDRRHAVHSRRACRASPMTVIDSVARCVRRMCHGMKPILVATRCPGRLTGPASFFTGCSSANWSSSGPVSRAQIMGGRPWRMNRRFPDLCLCVRRDDHTS